MENLKNLIKTIEIDLNKLKNVDKFYLLKSLDAEECNICFRDASHVLCVRKKKYLYLCPEHEKIYNRPIDPNLNINNEDIINLKKVIKIYKENLRLVFVFNNESHNQEIKKQRKLIK